MLLWGLEGARLSGGVLLGGGGLTQLTHNVAARLARDVTVVRSNLP